MSALIPAAFSSMNVSPAFFFARRLSDDCLKTNHSAAEMTPPATSTGIVRQFQSPVPLAAGSTVTSSSSANVHRLPAIAAKTARR